MRIPRTWLERTPAALRVRYGALPPEPSALQGQDRVDVEASIGPPGEAPCFLFLAWDDASYMTGQVLHPNGGEIING